MLHIKVFGTRWVALDAGRSTVRRAETIHLGIDPERLHFFDRESGVRIA